MTSAVVWLAIGIGLNGILGCAEPPSVPPVTLGELTLARSQLVPERYTLEVPLFNTGKSSLHRYRISAQAAPITTSEAESLGYPVMLEVEQALRSRARAVQTITFDCPLPVVPLEGLALQNITFFDFQFQGGPVPGEITYRYSVEETL